MTRSSFDIPKIKPFMDVRIDKTGCLETLKSGPLMTTRFRITRGAYLCGVFNVITNNDQRRYRNWIYWLGNQNSENKIYFEHGGVVLIGDNNQKVYFEVEDLMRAENNG